HGDGEGRGGTRGDEQGSGRTHEGLFSEKGAVRRGGPSPEHDAFSYGMAGGGTRDRGRSADRWEGGRTGAVVGVRERGGM
ncbi:hypothetical protein, partial [Streptomyces nodosus]|uniref:hypothetical protein n=1 Tax=Streptomyces nodosus TaxID=40318 RepID=UPI001D1006D1